LKRRSSTLLHAFVVWPGFRLGIRVKSDGKVNGVGQECPTHTSDVKVESGGRVALGLGHSGSSPSAKQVPHRAFGPIRNDIPFLLR
jgi:hypothetical protein